MDPDNLPNCSDCSDLDYSDCIQYPDYREWNQDGNVCQDIGSGGDNDSFIEPSCISFDQTDPKILDVINKSLSDI
jgi:hypothetical protein